MRHQAIKYTTIALTSILCIVIICNVIVIVVSKGKCYSSIEEIPHSTYGLLLGTGRSSAPSPYYDARIQAAIDLYKAGKVDYIVISAENLYPNYNEVDSMVTALSNAGIDIDRVLIDAHGTNTYASLQHLGKVGYRQSITIISQHFHNQRAIFYGALLFKQTPIAYNAQDTNIWYWNIYCVIRESLARTKAVVILPYLLFS